MSIDFKKQKSLLSTRTTMIGLNNENLIKIKLKKPKNKSNDLANLLYQLLNIKKFIDELKSKYINLLIKCSNM